MDYDLLILGGGSAGYAAARTGAEEGLRTCVVEGAEELGGLCILRGCMPSKALIETANRNLDLRAARTFGLLIEGTTRVDMPALQARKQMHVNEFAEYRAEQLQEGQFDLLRGKGRFISPNALELESRDDGTRRVSFSQAIVATGSRPFRPEIPGMEESGVLGSAEVLAMSSTPESAVILGGGAVGVEMAHFFDGIGVTTSIVQRSDHLLSAMERELGEVLARAMIRRGISVYTGADIRKIERTQEDAVHVEFDQGGDARHIDATTVIGAFGRKPATQTVDLGKAGVRWEEDGGVAILGTLQSSSAAHIFAVGDCASGQHQVVHEAVQQGEIAARNAARRHRGKTSGLEEFDTSGLMGIFTEPQVAAVGANEADLISSGTPHLAAKHPFADHGKAILHGVEEGFVKLVAEPTSGRLLGASAVGPQGVELIHPMSLAIHLGATASEVVSAPWYHPTLSEIWTYPLEEIVERC